MKTALTDGRGAAAFARARGVVAYWQGDQFVIENFMARTRVAAPPVATRVLDLCSTAQTIQALIRELPEFPAADVRRLVRDLVRLRLLEPRARRRGSRPRAAAATADGWTGWNPAAGFFHFSTKDVAFPTSPEDAARLWRTFGPVRPMPSPVKRSAGGARVRLPHAEPSDALASVLLDRRTWREFAREPLGLEQLATVLHLTWGIQRWGRVPRQGKIALKTSPSGGARHAGEVYVLARRVKGLRNGLYHYEPDSRGLVRLPRQPRATSMAKILPGQPWFRDAPALFIMTAVFERAQWRYAFPRAYRAVLIEAGHLCQTCCLVATSLGLAPFCSMAFPDSHVEGLLGIDGVGESAIYIAGVGVRPRHGWRPWQPARARQTSKEAPWPRV